jgi:DNA polymerase-3 subunit delta'
MTVEAQNCLLKTLEEPPEFAIIILITSNENSILNTIKSRCMTIKFKNISDDELKKYAMDKLGYTQMTENFLKSFNGSIGKAIIQKENQEKYLTIENIIDNLRTQDIISIMNDAKVIYDKENIYKILEYMIICVYSKKQDDIRYINCVEIINNCIARLKRNCNFDMSVDTMLFEMWEVIQK